jgi:hypothetical protein
MGYKDSKARTTAMIFQRRRIFPNQALCGGGRQDARACP